MNVVLDDIALNPQLAPTSQENMWRDTFTRRWNIGYEHSFDLKTGDGRHRAVKNLGSRARGAGRLYEA